MLLGAIVLKNVQSVNSFLPATQVTLRQANPNTIYIRLVDLEQTDQYGNSLRYIPLSGASLTATIGALNEDDVINRLATQPFSADDRSIFAVNILATDVVSQGNLDIMLTEGSTVRTATITNAIVIWTSNPSIC